MISAILLLAVVHVKLLSAFPLNERQVQCSNLPTVPSRCEDAIRGYTRELQSISSSGLLSNLGTAAEINHIERVLEPYLDELCAPYCLEPITTVLKCRNEEQSANVFENVVCRRDGGTYCLIKLLQANASGSPLVPTCALNRACSSSCAQTLRTLQERAGCCAASYYKTPGSSLDTYSAQFTTCGVSLGNTCQGDSQNQSGAIIGGVIGGIVLLGIVGAILIVCKKQHRRPSQPPHRSSSQPVSRQPHHPPPPPPQLTFTPAPPSSSFTFTEPSDPTITEAAPPPYHLHKNYSVYNGDPSTDDKLEEPPPYKHIPAAAPSPAARTVTFTVLAVRSTVIPS